MRAWRGGSSWPAPGRVRQDRPVADWARLAGHPVAWLSLDAGTTTRPGSGGTRWPRWTGPVPESATGGWVARPARAGVVPGPGHGADQRPGRGGGPARPRRLPRDQRAAGARVARRSWSSTGRPGYAWCWPAAAIRRCRWRGCGPRPAAEVRAADCGSRPRRPGSCSSTQRRRCRMRRWRRWRPGPRAGRPGCGWPRCRCAARTMPPRFVAGSPAAAIRPGLPGRRSARPAGRATADLPVRALVLDRLSSPCTTPSPAASAARRCSRRRTGGLFLIPLDSCAAGRALTTCSPTCSAPACCKNSPAAGAAAPQRRGLVLSRLADDAIRHAAARRDDLGRRLIERHFDTVLLLAQRGSDDPALGIGAPA